MKNNANQSTGKNKTTQKKSVEIGQWVLIAHGRWTRQVMLDQGDIDVDVRMVDENDILLISEEEPDVNTITAPYK